MPLRLRPHDDHVEEPSALAAYCRALRKKDPGSILAADLFSGAGGMSLGLEDAGMHVVFGADFDADALETHAHHFGGMSVGWDLGDGENVDRVGEILRSVEIDVIAGGPPCQPFSKAGRSKMRHLVREGLRESHDRRRDLWESYLEIIRIAQPRAVIMENVPDMALDREMFILRSMTQRLEDWGYSVQEQVVDTSRFGVPQFRQRLILIALRDGSDFAWPVPAEDRVTLGNAISDLPGVDPKAGWQSERSRSDYKPYQGPVTAFQKEMRQGVPSHQRFRIYDHVTRKVRDDDLVAFEHLDTKTKYSDLPDEVEVDGRTVQLKRYRDDIFDDKYKRLDGNDLSRTITAHIAKDGYWYIHPKENRTLTVREAARVQTFPDQIRFAGSPTSAFRQIGNAVPPKLGYAVGLAVIDGLTSSSHRSAVPSSKTCDALAGWFDKHQELIDPWITSASRWKVIMGETLLGGESAVIKRSLWPLLAHHDSPQSMLDARERVREAASWVNRDTSADRLVAIAELLTAGTSGPGISDTDLQGFVSEKLLSNAAAELAMVVQSQEEEPVIATSGALRVAGRFFRGTESWLRNRNSDGRIAVARLIGNSDSSRTAQLALIELGQRTCTPKAPECVTCPLSTWCRRNLDSVARKRSEAERRSKFGVPSADDVDGTPKLAELVLFE